MKPSHFLLPLGFVLALSPWASPGLSLLGGAAIGLAWGNPYLRITRKLAHALLVAAIVGLGAGMDLRVVAQVGAHGIGYTAASIAGALLLGTLLARALRVQTRPGLLISVGTAICGGSAIAAVAPALRAEEHEVTVAFGTVFLLNAAALVLFPTIGHAVGLSQESFGLWSALAIHDTSSVVGASMAYGTRALEVATTVKLTRALWIVPVTLLIAHAMRQRCNAAGEAGKTVAAPKPWFIAAFLVASALVTFVPGLSGLGAPVSLAARHAMSAMLFLVGTAISRSALRAVGVRALAQGVLLWIIVAGGSLLFVTNATVN
ncbi:putative sulfate exporter family transporter [Pendulispora rubella]|uniref:Sulfate exporter family transporter n=1 Tax=Pendulispora rubella TaxID=2741070 RepID=A0ABZ2KZ51_9BACT